MKRHHINPLQCGESQSSFTPWISFIHKGKRITLTHVSAPTITGLIQWFTPFEEIGFGTRLPNASRINCLHDVFRKTHPHILIITGLLYPHEIARMMAILPPSVTVVYYGQMPAFFLDNLADLNLLDKTAYQIKNWIFVAADHISLSISNGSLEFSVLRP